MCGTLKRVMWYFEEGGVVLCCFQDESRSDVSSLTLALETLTGAVQEKLPPAVWKRYKSSPPGLIL